MVLKPWNRRSFLAVSASASASLLHASRVRAAQEPDLQPVLRWYNVQDWDVEGRGWTDQRRQRYYDRFPAKAQSMVREAVWDLSRDSAGMLAEFETDSPEIQVRYRLFRQRLAMPHMPATGVSGVDLYGLDARGTWRWIGVARPDSETVSYRLAANLDGGVRRYRIYLPLYNGVDSLEIGVHEDRTFTGIPPRSSKPIVFYGTSITHGACASRPGMPHPAILGRRLNRPVINLGFSGNGRMEKEVGSLLCELDPAAYVIDCLPNMNGEQVRERAEPLVRQLRQAHPEVPIVLVEDRSFTNAWVFDERRNHHARSRTELRGAFDRLVKDGTQRLHYLEGEALLGDDSEGATDGSHPSDLGFFRQAHAFEPVLTKALSG